MHKQFKKFGFFVSKNIDNEDNDTKNNEKIIKYLYRSDVGNGEKVHRRKVRNLQAGESPPQKYTTKKLGEENGDKHRHRKKSHDSVHKKHRREIHPFTSTSEMIYASPEEMKRHSRKTHRSKEKVLEIKKRHKYGCPEYDHESERLQDTKKLIANELAKFIKEHKLKSKDSTNREDCQWLTKKEIFKLINNPICFPNGDKVSSSFLKKFFLFDKKELLQETIKHIDVNCCTENTNPALTSTKPSLASAVRKVERTINDKNEPDLQNYEKLYNQNHRQKNESSERQNIQKHHSEMQLVPPKNKTKKRREHDSDGFKFVELPTVQKELAKVKSKRKPRESESAIIVENVSGFSQTEMKLKRRSHSRKNKGESDVGDSLFKLKPNYVNPKRHKFCLVKDTFSIVEIPSTCPPNSQLEKKKKSKAFKKYYRYDDDCEIRTETYYTFSDSNKMYQDTSEHSEEPVMKRHRNTNKNYISPSQSEEELKVETHISAFAITSDSARYTIKTSQSKDSDKKNKKTNKVVRKSKIPVLSNTSKMASSLKQTFTNPRTYKEKKYETVVSPRSSKDKEKHLNSHKQNEGKMGERVLSARSNKDEVQSPKSKKKNDSVIVKSPSPKPSKRQTIDTTKTKSLKEQNSGAVKEKPSSPKTVRDKTADKKERTSTRSVREKSVEVVRNISTPRSARQKNTEVEREKSSSADKSCDRKGKVENVKKVNTPKPTQLPSSNKGAQLVSKTKGNVLKTSYLAEDSKISKRESKMSELSSISKQSKWSGTDKPIINKRRNFSLSPPPTYRRKLTSRSTASSVTGDRTPSRQTTGGSSSMWSKSSKKSTKTSKSDTKLQGNKKMNVEKGYRNVERTSTKASFSNSTFADRSLDSSSPATSFLLTKSFKDDDRLTRWQRQKLYSDNVRRRNQKSSLLPPQVVEVRYLAISDGKNDENLFMRENDLNFQDSHTMITPELMDKLKAITSSSVSELETVTVPETIVATIESKPESKPEEKVNELTTEKKFYEDDLPEPCCDPSGDEKFNSLFQLPLDKALNEILHENYNFLKKDFSFIAPEDKCCSSDDDHSSFNSVFDKKFDNWSDCKIGDEDSFSEISCCNRTVDETKDIALNMGSQDHIVDSRSAPGSEESGYSTIKSRPISKSFFERPIIKALLEPCYDTPDSFCLEVQVESKSSSKCGLEIHSIESKSLQTTVECSQKSVQIKLSQEEIVETINFSGRNRESTLSEDGEEITILIEQRNEQSTVEQIEEQELVESEDVNVVENEDVRAVESEDSKMVENEQPHAELSNCCEEEGHTSKNKKSEATLQPASSESSGDWISVSEDSEVAVKTSGDNVPLKEIPMTSSNKVINNEKVEVKKKTHNIKKKKHRLSLLSCFMCVPNE